MTVDTESDWVLGATFNSTSVDPASSEGHVILARVILLMSLDYAKIDFGVQNPRSIGVNASLNNYGGYGISIDPSSCDVDGVYVKGTDLNAVSVPELQGVVYKLGYRNISWNDDANDYTHPATERMSLDYTMVRTGVKANSSFKTYYWLDIPGGLYAQNYTGTVSILANTSSM